MRINKINAGSLALRGVCRKYHNLSSEASQPITLSKNAPYFGYIDVKIGKYDPFIMFSNNDDFVAKSYFWNDADAYEPMSLKLWNYLAESSAAIIDIGAYTGVYSLSAASVNPKSKVHAFEALDLVYGRLIINKNVNNFGNLNAHNIAVSDKEGIVEFNVYAGDSVLSTGSSLIDENIDRPVYIKKRVKSARLDYLFDELNLNRIDLIKVDAERAEHLIFKGAEKIIQQFTPDIICEILQGSHTTEIEKIFEPIGYRYFRIDEKNMRIDQVKNITSAETMDDLNILITKKTIDQIHNIFKNEIY